MSLRRVRRVALVGALALTAALSACGDGSTPTSVPADTPASTAAVTTAAATTTTATTMSTTTSTETTAPATTTTVAAESTSRTSEPAGTAVGPDVSVDADTVWEEVFGTFTASEQSCIRDAVDPELLESVLGRRVLESSDVPEQWEVSIFSCLAPPTARALFLSFMIAGMEDDEELAMELTEEEMSCLREWVAGVDVATAVAALADEDSAAGGELVSGMFSCLTDLFLSMMVSEMGMDGVGMSEEEMSCLREWVAGMDMGALVAGFEDEDLAVLGELVTGLLGCAPDVFLSAMLEEVGVELGELADEEASCLREWLTGTDFAALFTGDPGTALAFVPDLLECIPDLLDVSVPPDPGTPLSIAFEDATVVAVDEEVQGELDEPDESDLFLFEAMEGKLYQIDVALGTLGDSVVTLYDSEAAVLDYNDDYGGSAASRIVWAAPSSGTYYVEVGSWGGGTGSYTLTVVAFEVVDDHADTTAEATSATVGEPLSGVVDHPDDIDLFVFEAVDGELYQIDVTLGTLADSVVALYDADEWELASNDDYEGSSASRIVWAAPSSGTYYVEVGSWGGGTGSYTLTVVVSDIADDHADMIEEATVVTVGGAALGAIDYIGDVDLFVFEAVQRELYQIDVALGTLSDSVVGVYDADERELAFNDDYEGTSASRVFWEAPSSGSYYVAVASWGDGTGSYTLTIIVR